MPRARRRAPWWTTDGCGSLAAPGTATLTPRSPGASPRCAARGRAGPAAVPPRRSLVPGCAAPRVQSGLACGRGEQRGWTGRGLGSPPETSDGPLPPPQTPGPLGPVGPGDAAQLERSRTGSPPETNAPIHPQRPGPHQVRRDLVMQRSWKGLLERMKTSLVVGCLQARAGTGRGDASKGWTSGVWSREVAGRTNAHPLHRTHTPAPPKTTHTYIHTHT